MLAVECGEVQITQQERAHEHPMFAPNSGQLWVRAGVHGGIPCAHACGINAPGDEGCRRACSCGGGLGLLPIPSHQAGAQRVLPGTAPSPAGKLLSGEAGLISLLNLPP